MDAPPSVWAWPDQTGGSLCLGLMGGGRPWSTDRWMSRLNVSALRVGNTRDRGLQIASFQLIGTK